MQHFRCFGLLPSSPTTAPEAQDMIRLSRLCHSVVAPGVEERLLIRISDFDMGLCPYALSELRCKAYVGPKLTFTAKASSDGTINKSRFLEVKLEFRKGVAEAEFDIGVPQAHEPWVLKVKLYRRPISAFFQQEKVAECVSTLPRAKGRVDLLSAMAPLQALPIGSAHLEVVRLVPESAADTLAITLGRVLVRSISAGVPTAELRELLNGGVELGPDALRTQSASEALNVAASVGRLDVVADLLHMGVSPTAEASRVAEQGGHLSIAYGILARLQSHDQPASLLARALENRLPLLAEFILERNPSLLVELPPAGGAAVRKAHGAGCWSVLAALLDRGDPMPVPARLLLDYALRVGHPGLARACLSRCEGFEDIEGALKTCLDNGKVEIVREALEAQWRMRASQWAEGDYPAFLDIECGPANQPAECGVCFDPLHEDPGVMLSEHGYRCCSHYICTECAESIQDEAANRVLAWRARLETRIPKPLRPCCPLCRTAFVEVKRLPDPTVDPRTFFFLGCVPPDGGATTSREALRLTCKAALETLCAALPLNPERFAPRLQNTLWPTWTQNAGQEAQESGLSESDFMRPGGMLAWLSDSLLELKVEEIRGVAPSLEREPVAWFHHFDYDGKGFLSKPELLRGVAKAYDVAILASATTPRRRARKVGVQKLRELVEAVWDESRWQDGVPLCDFEGRQGLAKRILAALRRSSSEDNLPAPPEEEEGRSECSSHRCPKEMCFLSVEEALARSRKADFEEREEWEQRARERAEARQKKADTIIHMGHGQPAASIGPLSRQELLLSSIRDAGQFQSRRGAEMLVELRIQRPFCSAINACRAAIGHRVVCGSCRSVFAVPSPALSQVVVGGRAANAAWA